MTLRHLVAFIYFFTKIMFVSVIHVNDFYVYLIPEMYVIKASYNKQYLNL